MGTRITRRELRLGSGAVMFAYVAVHFVDHALGLVSLDAAERALALSVAVWHSGPGSVLLYGAAALHVALALRSIYERRTWRMPAVQALRIALGLAMPVMLIGHAIATRLAADLYQLAPTYHRIVWALWATDGEGRQIVMQAPGWVHGCLGLKMALQHRRGWPRVRWVLFGAALLLPILAALGFLAMGRELAALAAAAGSPDATPQADLPTRIALGRLRDGAVAAWFALAALPFAAAALRGRLERQRRLLVPIVYPQRTVQVPRGWSVLEASRGFGIPHLSLCGGNARCSTCRVRVSAGSAALPPPQELERRTLNRIGAAPDVRLACQLRPHARVAVQPLLDPASGSGRECEAAPAIVEGERAVLLVRLAHWRSTAGADVAAADAAYAINRVLDGIAEAIAAEGGQPGRFDSEGASAGFDGGGDPRRASQQAFDAARAIRARLPALNAALAREVGLAVDAAIAVHLGTLAQAPIGRAGERTTLPVGEAMRDARALRDHAAAQGLELVVSRGAAEAIGLAPPAGGWLRIAVPRVAVATEALAIDAARRDS